MSGSALPHAVEAIAVLGKLIAVRRREIGFTAEDLAARVGVSRTTLRKIERGDPGVAIGSFFTAAVVVGIPLLQAADRRELAARGHDLSQRLAILPAHVHLPAVDDDF